MPRFYIFILGCQRSGTTLLERIFRQDMNSAVFGEFSELSIAPEKTVWRPLDDVASILNRQHYEYAVTRPLFESDRAADFVDYFRPSVAVWVYRDYRYVVNSMVNKWRSDFFKISSRVEADSQDTWRLQATLEEINREALQLTGSSEKIEDLYALYWLKRNMILLETALAHNPQVLVLDYSTLVSSTSQTVEKIMRQAGGRGLWRGFSTDADRGNATKQIHINISAPIALKCEEAMKKLGHLGSRDFGITC